MKEFTDANGNVVRLLRAGTGSTLVFTNVDTGKQLSLKSNGSVENIVLNANGSQTFTVIGHNVLILFPGDTPSGPSSILYVGRIVFQQSPDFVTTIQSGPVARRRPISAQRCRINPSVPSSNGNLQRNRHSQSRLLASVNLVKEELCLILD